MHSVLFRPRSDRGAKNAIRGLRRKKCPATIIPFHDILLAEDDPVLLGLLGQILETAGYTVQPVADGRTALRHLTGSSSIRLIITDIFMPGADGFELLAMLRGMRPSPPVIVMSGGGVGGIDLTLKTAGHLGARHVLAKPFALQTLLAAVYATIGSPRGTRYRHPSSTGGDDHQA